tara:strand:+ start:136 stop:474 length:339 start_codon:yes stop_codon:yes gene_type:complete
MSDNESIEEDARSVDSVCVVEVLEVQFLDGFLGYECKTSDGTIDVFDRSDLMDGGPTQAMVLAFERKHPPPWDVECVHCQGEGCGECLCEECDRPCRHINGVNYGCVKHPVV